VLDSPSTEAIRSVRQVTLLYKKIELETSDLHRKSAYEGFVKSDADVGEWEDSVSFETLADFRRMASLLFSQVFRKVDQTIANFEANDNCRLFAGGLTPDQLATIKSGNMIANMNLDPVYTLKELRDRGAFVDMYDWQTKDGREADATILGGTNSNIRLFAPFYGVNYMYKMANPCQALVCTQDELMSWAANSKQTDPVYCGSSGGKTEKGRQRDITHELMHTIRGDIHPGENVIGELHPEKGDTEKTIDDAIIRACFGGLLQ